MAVKTLKELRIRGGRQSQEAAIMGQFKHRNVVTMFILTGVLVGLYRKVMGYGLWGILDGLLVGLATL